MSFCAASVQRTLALAALGSALLAGSAVRVEVELHSAAGIGQQQAVAVQADQLDCLASGALLGEE